MTNVSALRFPTLTIEHPLERVAMRVLVAAVMALVIAYVYLIAASTFNIIARKQAEVSSVTIQGTLAQLSSQYYELSKQVTLARATSMGLSPIAQKDYVTRSSHLSYVAPAAQ